MTKKYYKKDLLEILNKILNYENVLENIKTFQNIMWEDNELPDLELSNSDREIFLDLAIDLDFFGQNVSQKDKESGIKDIKDDKRELFDLLKIALGKLTNP